MDIPNLTGYRLDKGLAILKDDFQLLDVSIREYTIPDDFYKKNVGSGIKRIVRQRGTARDGMELTVFAFKETPESPL